MLEDGLMSGQQMSEMLMLELRCYASQYDKCVTFIFFFVAARDSASEQGEVSEVKLKIGKKTIKLSSASDIFATIP